ncbi:hypothetical protein MMC34_004255 [Xylographa carneopallida]|nr:hypothetical protein [Xylographa carneopallida]
MPIKGQSIEAEIVCYNLPYGAIGFLSHLLTYYTITLLYLKRSPWLPWLRLTHSTLDKLLASLTFLATVILSLFTIVRCSQRWAFVLIAIWKLLLALTLSFCAWDAARVSTREKKYLADFHVRGGKKAQYDYDRVETGEQNDTQTAYPMQPRPMFAPPAETAKQAVLAFRTNVSWWWLFLYCLGMTIGFVGLVSLVLMTWENKDVRIVTYVFGSVAGAGILFTIVVVAGCCYCDDDDDDKSGCAKFWSVGAWTFGGGLTVCIGCVMVFGAFYSDWILGAIAHNLVGVPDSGDGISSILYWVRLLALSAFSAQLADILLLSDLVWSKTIANVCHMMLRRKWGNDFHASTFWKVINNDYEVSKFRGSLVDMKRLLRNSSLCVIS